MKLNPLTHDSWASLMKVLDRDSVQTGVEYERLRLLLVAFFTLRRATDPLFLTDLTFDRLALLATKGQFLHADSFIYGVARNILREDMVRRPLMVSLVEAQQAPSPTLPDKEAISLQLERCLLRFTPDEREILISYYKSDGLKARFNRLATAKRLNLSPKTLRNRASLLRLRLAEYLKKDRDVLEKNLTH